MRTNLRKIKTHELLAEMSRRGLLSDRSIAEITKKLYGQDTLTKRSENWINQNPEVFKVYESLALRLYKEDKHASSRLLIETIRSANNIKIPNAVTKYLNRKLIQAHPELSKLFSRKRCPAVQSCGPATES